MRTAFWATGILLVGLLAGWMAGISSRPQSPPMAISGRPLPPCIGAELRKPSDLTEAESRAIRYALEGSFSPNVAGTPPPMRVHLNADRIHVSFTNDFVLVVLRVTSLGNFNHIPAWRAKYSRNQLEEAYSYVCQEVVNHLCDRLKVQPKDIRVWWQSDDLVDEGFYVDGKLQVRTLAGEDTHEYPEYPAWHTIRRSW